MSLKFVPLTFVHSRLMAHNQRRLDGELYPPVLLILRGVVHVVHDDDQKQCQLLGAQPHPVVAEEVNRS